jgi:hypothetical protein
MVFLVPYDGSTLARSALAKARLHGIALGESPAPLRRALYPSGEGDRPEVVAYAVVPESGAYAVEKGWAESRAAFDPRETVASLEREVLDVTPNARFHADRVPTTASGVIAGRIRRTAVELGATDVYLGSENAGRIVSPVTSAARHVAGDDRYDVTLVRRPLPERVVTGERSDLTGADRAGPDPTG